MKLELTINQRIYSKKNSRRFIRRGGKGYVIPSLGFERSKDTIMAEIYKQLGNKIPSKPIFDEDISVQTTLYIPGAFRADGDNLHTSLLDILEDARVIGNDSKVIQGSYCKIMGSDFWSCHIIIKSIDRKDLVYAAQNHQI